MTGEIAGYDPEAKPIPADPAEKIALIDDALANLDIDVRDSMEDTLNRIMDIITPPYATEADAQHDIDEGLNGPVDKEMGGWEPRS